MMRVYQGYVVYDLYRDFSYIINIFIMHFCIFEFGPRSMLQHPKIIQLFTESEITINNFESKNGRAINLERYGTRPTRTTITFYY